MSQWYDDSSLGQQMQRNTAKLKDIMTAPAQTEQDSIEDMRRMAAARRRCEDLADERKLRDELMP